MNINNVFNVMAQKTFSRNANVPSKPRICKVGIINNENQLYKQYNNNKYK